MTRLACRRLLTIAATTAAVLVAPAAASAATYTVKPGDGACTGGDLACGGFAEAAAAVNAGAGGDTINVSAGVYPGATFTAGGLTITGVEPGVIVNSTLTFSNAGGATSKLSKVAVATTSGPGVLVSAAPGLVVSDCAIVAQSGHGVQITAGTANKIVRSLVNSGGGGSSAIRVESGANGGPRGLTVESTIAVGGAFGISAATESALVLGPAGTITLTLRHISAQGATNAIKLDASLGANALNLGAGNIAATMTDSIAFNNASANYGGVLNLGANTATLGATRSLTTGNPASVFASPAGRNLRLRPDAAAAIGQGSVVAAESTTDFEGEDRAAAPTDLGADEFNNAPPVAKLVIATKTPRATQPVRFDASTSVDREATYGGGIVQYQWLFSDGTGQTTTTPTVDHAYPKEGGAAVQLTVVDRQGAASAPVAAGLNLIDGTPPAVSIVKPKNKAKIKIFTTKTDKKTKKKTKTRTKIVFGGLSKDANGIASIILTLEKLPAATSGTNAQASAAPSAKCTWYDPKKGLTRKACAVPVFFTAALKKDSKTGEWSYTVKRNLSAGTYRLSAVGVDKTGAIGNSGGTKLGVSRFTLK